MESFFLSPLDYPFWILSFLLLIKIELSRIRKILCKLNRSESSKLPESPVKPSFLSDLPYKSLKK